MRINFKNTKLLPLIVNKPKQAKPDKRDIFQIRFKLFSEILLQIILSVLSHVVPMDGRTLS